MLGVLSVLQIYYPWTKGDTDRGRGREERERKAGKQMVYRGITAKESLH
jgi:hypothetical protein